MDKSYTIDELKQLSPLRTKLTLIPIQTPEGISEIRDSSVPLPLFHWDYLPNERFYIITAQNKGEGIARKIKIDIDFTPNAIKSLDIDNKDRLKILQGGQPSSTRVLLIIDELLPDEVQSVKILIAGKEYKSISGWEESEGIVKNICVFDVAFELNK
jgi:hypothetical protein